MPRRLWLCTPPSTAGQSSTGRPTAPKPKAKRGPQTRLVHTQSTDQRRDKMRFKTDLRNIRIFYSERFPAALLRRRSSKLPFFPLGPCLIMPAVAQKKN